MQKYIHTERHTMDLLFSYNTDILKLVNNAKIIQARLQQYVNRELPDV